MQQNVLELKSADGLSANQQRALQGLLTTTSIAAAAREAGLSEKTVRRYLADPAFAQEYREQRALALQETVAALQASSADAITTMRASLGAADENTRLRAARAIIELGYRGVDLERQVRDQEELITLLREAKNDGPWDWRR